MAFRKMCSKQIGPAEGVKLNQTETVQVSSGSHYKETNIDSQFAVGSQPVATGQARADFDAILRGIGCVFVRGVAELTDSVHDKCIRSILA